MYRDSADASFPFPIRLDRIKPIMSDHFSRYGTIRAIQPRETTADAAHRAVVVFWVSHLVHSKTMLADDSLLNRSKAVWRIQNDSLVYQDRTQLPPGSLSISNLFRLKLPRSF